jgi:hypothetical protein
MCGSTNRIETYSDDPCSQADRELPEGHARVPFAGYRPDHRARIKLAPIDFDTKAPLEDELDMVVLDTVSRAGDRFGRLLHMLVGHSSTA